MFLIIRLFSGQLPSYNIETHDFKGLLIEPSPPHTVASMLITNDLTEVVAREAVEKQANLILSYHPPIFKPLKQLTQSQWKERIVIKCVFNQK